MSHPTESCGTAGTYIPGIAAFNVMIFDSTQKNLAGFRPNIRQYIHTPHSLRPINLYPTSIWDEMLDGGYILRNRATMLTTRLTAEVFNRNQAVESKLIRDVLTRL